MNIVQLVYSSRLAPNTNPSEIAKIHKTSVENNENAALTGALLFGEDCFLQCLEGSRETVSRLYSVIANDPRHVDCELLLVRDVTQRSFSKWDMKLILLTDQNRKELMRFSASANFQPHLMSGDSAIRLLESFKT